MRILPACTAAAFFLTASATGALAAGPSCPKPFEQTAFDVIQLKSALMVGALSCGVSNRYDAFMQHFQSYILQEQQVMDRFFHRTGGGQAQVDEDQYVTLLANAQSQASIGEGKAYCGSVAGLFSQVAAVRQDPELEGLADDQASVATGLPQPCGGGAKSAAAVLAANAAAAKAASPREAPAAAGTVQNLAAEVPAATPASAASLAALSRQIQALQSQLAAMQAGVQAPAVPAADRTASAAIPRPNTPS